jgi:hypothetical protein
VQNPGPRRRGPGFLVSAPIGGGDRIAADDSPR